MVEDTQFYSWLNELRNDRSHGASELARQCLDQASQSARSVDAADLKQFQDKLDQRCQAMITALITEARQAATNGATRAAAIIGDSKTLLTHSFSSTVLGVLTALRNRNVSVIATESRPLNEGHATARHLSKLGIPVTLITEAQIGLSIPDVDAVLVGADGILSDGSIVNKAGTYLAALAALDQSIPFYVCAESFKRWPPGMAPRELDLAGC